MCSGISSGSLIFVPPDEPYQPKTIAVIFWRKCDAKMYMDWYLSSHPEWLEINYTDHFIHMKNGDFVQFMAWMGEKGRICADEVIDMRPSDV